MRETFFGDRRGPDWDRDWDGRRDYGARQGRDRYEER